MTALTVKRWEVYIKEEFGANKKHILAVGLPKGWVLFTLGWVRKSCFMHLILKLAIDGPNIQPVHGIGQ